MSSSENSEIQPAADPIDETAVTGVEDAVLIQLSREALSRLHRHFCGNTGRLARVQGLFVPQENDGLFLSQYGTQTAAELLRIFLRRVDADVIDARLVTGHDHQTLADSAGNAILTDCLDRGSTARTSAIDPIDRAAASVIAPGSSVYVVLAGDQDGLLTAHQRLDGTTLLTQLGAQGIEADDLAFHLTSITSGVDPELAVDVVRLQRSRGLLLWHVLLPGGAARLVRAAVLPGEIASPVFLPRPAGAAERAAMLAAGAGYLVARDDVGPHYLEAHPDIGCAADRVITGLRAAGLITRVASPYELPVDHFSATGSKVSTEFLRAQIHQRS